MTTDDPLIGRDEAAAILRRLKIAVTKTMPKPVMISRREADQRKAAEMIAREMQASIDRCQALERELQKEPV